MAADVGGAFGAIDRMHAIPDGRIRRLIRHDRQGDVAHLLADQKAHGPFGQDILQGVERLPVDGFCALGAAAKIPADLNRVGATPEPHFKAPAAELIKHADFFRKAYRVVER